MKMETYNALRNELYQKDYGTYGKNSITSLFKIYCEHEINSFNDLFNDHRVFLQFVKENISLFRSVDKDRYGKILPEEKQVLFQFAYQEFSKFNLFSSRFFSYYRKEQEKWAQMVEHIVGKSTVNLLELGSGTIPYSSFLIAKDIGEISSMDKFNMSLNTLKKLNVNGINGYFDEETDTSNYDIIVGNRPCSAFKYITMKHTPYFVRLCKCESPTDDLLGWQNILRKFDSKIKFSKNGEYAYNLNGNTDIKNEEDVEKIVAENEL